MLGSLRTALAKEMDTYLIIGVPLNKCHSPEDLMNCQQNAQLVCKLVLDMVTRGIPD
jgi:hypothetical protein